MTSPDDPPKPVAATTEIQDIYCAEGGLKASWKNHHSHLYLTASSSGTTFSVTRNKTPEIDGCVHKLAVGGMCLESSNAVAMIDAKCTNRKEQLWVIENHWHHEGVMWQRFHPADRLDLCLQEQTAEESANPQAVLKPCGTNWIQQWQLQPQVNVKVGLCW